VIRTFLSACEPVNTIGMCKNNCGFQLSVCEATVYQKLNGVCSELMTS